MVKKNQINRVFEVLDFPKSRVGAKIVNLYRQDITPKEAFENARFQSLSRAPKRDQGSGRPTKKDRREIENYREDEIAE